MYLRLIELCLGIQFLFYTFICKRQQLTKAIFLFRKVAQKIKTNFGILSKKRINHREYFIYRRFGIMVKRRMKHAYLSN